MKAVIYCRFSPRPDEKNCLSNEIQLEACLKYCKDQSLEVAGMYEDKAKSGKESDDRPGLWDAIVACPKAGVVVVYAIDRLARNVMDAEIIHAELRKKGAAVMSVTGAVNGDEPEQVFCRQVMQAQAEFVRKSGNARTKAFMLAHQRAGRRMSQIPPYGWMIDPKDPKRMLPHPEEHKNLVRIRELREMGLKYRAIARALVQEGRLFRGHAGWHLRSLIRIAEREMID